MITKKQSTRLRMLISIYADDVAQAEVAGSLPVEAAAEVRQRAKESREALTAYIKSLEEDGPIVSI